MNESRILSWEARKIETHGFIPNGVELEVDGLRGQRSLLKMREVRRGF